MKKIISLLLVVLVVFTCMPMNVFATASDYETEEKLTYSANNTVGDALLSAMSETQEETEKSGGYGIFGLTIEELTVNVSLSAPDNGTLVVAVYDEETMEMVTSGKVSVNSDMESTTLTLADCTLPDYYIIKAFLLDADNAPVCNQYENAEHTKAYEEFFAKTVYDFEEEQIINFDISDESNFAVVTDESTVVAYTKEENIVVTDDYENGIYVFKNANEKITSLVSGDILYYVYGEGADEYILTKVGSVKTEDGLTTVSAADECEMGELFSYIDIDTSKMETAQTYSTSFDEEGGQLDEEKSFSIGDDVEKEFTGSNYSLKISLSGKISFNLKFHYDLKLFGEDYYKFEYWAGLDANANVTFNANGSAEKKVNLVDKDITVFFGIDIHVELNVTLKASASITVTGNIDFTMKNGASRESGGVQKKIEQKPMIKLNLDIEGNYSFSVIPELITGFKVLKVYHVTLAVPVDFNTSGTLYVPTTDEEYAEHSCNACIDGTVSATPSLRVNVKFGIRKSHLMDIIDVTPLTKKIPLGDYYISLDGGIKFGWGGCPNNPSDTGSSGSSGSDDSGSSGILDELLITGKVTGTCGDNIYWTLYSDGELVIDGNGAMTDYLYTTDVPWYDCRAMIYNVTMSQGITNVGDCAFSGCTNLTNINIPDSITKLGWSSFEDCSSLTTVDIPDSVNDMGDYTFIGCSSLKEISIPYGVTELGWYIFSECKSLESIIIPDSVEAMLEGVFCDCTSLKSVKLSNKTIYMGTSVFLFCESLESVIIPESVTSIGETAFDSCTSLITITIPDNVTSIEFGTFYNCTNLKEVTLPIDLTSIGERAFAYCESLTDITIPNSVTSIGIGAFESCTSLKEITIPKNVNEIGENAFDHCESLTDITVDTDNTTYCSEEGVLFDIGKKELIRFPCGSNIESYFIPESVANVKSGAFYGCNNLVDVEIPDSVTTVGYSALARCSNLVNVIIGTGMTNIEYSMFSDCVALENILIPDSVTIIGCAAFENCTALSNIYYTGTEEQWAKITIDFFYNTCLTSAEIIYNYIPEENAVSVMSLSTEYDTYSTASEEVSVITRTKTINSAVAGNSYLILVIKDAEAEELLSSDNLVYIDQKVADSSSLTFEYTVTDKSALYTIVIISSDLSKQNHMHSYSKVTINPTCTEGGSATYSCECGYSYVEEIEPTGHNYISDVTKTPTHLTEGVMTYACECGDNYTETLERTKEHTYTSTVTAPTCTQGGYTTYTCSCGDTYTADETSALSHNMSDFVQTVAPTCTEKGTSRSDCSRCDYYETEEVALLPHTESQWIIDKAATCTAKGSKHIECTECHTIIKTEAVAIAAHTYGKTVVAPTCTQGGYTIYSCGECTYSYIADETPVTDHNYSDGVCTTCGDNKTDNCSCNCHKTGFMSFIWKILRFFYKLFKTNPVCSCGMAHY